MTKLTSMLLTGSLLLLMGAPGVVHAAEHQAPTGLELPSPAEWVEQVLAGWVSQIHDWVSIPDTDPRRQVYRADSTDLAGETGSAPSDPAPLEGEEVLESGPIAEPLG